MSGLRLGRFAVTAALCLASTHAVADVRGAKPRPAGAKAASAKAAKAAKAAKTKGKKPAVHKQKLTPGDVSFWQWLVEPNAAELEVVRKKADENLASAIGTYALWDYSGTFQSHQQANRDRVLEDALSMLRFGLRLEPDNADLKRQLGFVADERGDHELARQMLEQYLADEIPERIQPAARGRLGRLYARQERWDEAIVQLRLSLGDATTAGLDQAQSLLTLASVYMEQGRLTEAIDLLAPAAEANRFSYYSGYIVPFALAVAYDRDEQLTLASDTLEKMVAGGQSQGLMNVLFDTSNYARLTFSPAIDRHYFAGLQYEAMGNLSEAREEWSSYARSRDARYRDRARAHIAGIDVLLRDKMKNGKQKKKKDPGAATPTAPSGVTP